MTAPHTGGASVGAAGSSAISRFKSLIALARASTLARGAVLALTIQVAAGIARYLVQIFFARWGGPVEYGRYVYAFGWTQILIVPATLGLTLSVLRLVPQYIHEESWTLLRGLIRRTCQVGLIGSLVVTAAGLVVVLVASTGPTQETVALGIGLITVVGLVTVLRETTRGTQRVVLAYGVGDLLPMAVSLIAAAVLLSISGHLSGPEMLVATAIGFTIALSVQTITVRRALPRAFGRGVQAAYDLRGWILLSLPFLFVTIFTLVINQSDLLVLGSLKSARDVGIYAAGSKTAFLVSFVLTAVSAVLAPVIVRYHAAGDIAGLRDALRSGTQLILWPSLAIAGVLCLWPEIVLGAFGGGFQQAAPIVRILAIGQFINAVTGPAGYVLVLTGGQRTVMAIYGLAAVLELVLLLVLIPPYGPDGAAIATMVTVSLSNCVLYGFSRRKLRADEASNSDSKLGSFSADR